LLIKPALLLSAAARSRHVVVTFSSEAQWQAAS
jgi:hypothetical protein